MAREALHALPPEVACRAAIQALEEHPRATPLLLEDAGNKLGRAGHEKGRGYPCATSPI